MRDPRADEISGKEGGAPGASRRQVRLPIRVWVPFPAAYPLNEGLEHVVDFPRAKF